MKIHFQPKAFVISLSTTINLSNMGKLNKQLGEPLLNDLIQSLMNYNWNYEIFPAQDGYLMSNEQWKQEEIKIENHCQMRTLSGAIGCLYSHLQLWKKCLSLKEPIIVLEHDALVLNFFPKEINMKCDLLKLGKPFPEHDKKHPITGDWKLGAWSYLITPDGCNLLINALKKYGTIPTDVLIGKNIIEWDYITPSICELNHVSLLQSSTSLRNERLHKQKWSNPFMTTEELIDWLKFVFMKRNLELVFEYDNQKIIGSFKMISKNVSDKLLIQNIKTKQIFDLDVNKIKELNFI